LENKVLSAFSLLVSKAVLLVLLLLPLGLAAQDPLAPDANGIVAVPELPNPQRLVNDYAGVLSDAEEQQLEAKLVDFDRGSTVQIAVVTVRTTGISPIEDYAHALFAKWGIGQKGKDNGLLLLVAIDDRKSDIEVGYKLEDVAPDASCRQILDDVLPPYFRQQQYYDGINAATDSLFKLASGKYTYKAPAKATKSSRSRGIGFWVPLILILLYILSRFGKGGGGWGNRNRGGMFIPPIIGGGGHWGSFSSGSGSFGGGGSFGGFGGGSSGGGGASGSW